MTKYAPVFVAAVTATLALSGCRMQDRYGPVEVAPVPQVDEAIALRDWPVTKAEYAAGDVVAGSVGFLWEVDEDVEEPGNFALQVPAFLGNVIVLPVTIFLPPPTETMVYEGVVLPVTYTANPPLPKRATLPLVPEDGPTTLPAAGPDADAEVPDLVPTTLPTDDVAEGVVDPEPSAEVEEMPAAPRLETAPVAPMTPPATSPATPSFEK